VCYQCYIIERDVFLLNRLQIFGNGNLINVARDEKCDRFFFSFGSHYCVPILLSESETCIVIVMRHVKDKTKRILMKK
jgi:hypothetical protein